MPAGADRPTHHIGNPHEVPVLHLAETIKELADSSSEITFIERTIASFASHPS